MGRNLSTAIKSVLIVALLFTILFLSFVWVIQPHMFFYPWHDSDSYDRLLSDKSFEKITIKNDNLELHGWLRKNNIEIDAPLVVFFGGNAQNASNTCAAFLDQDRYAFFGEYNVSIVDYPGYGISEGTPSDKSMFNAALTIYDYACQMECVDQSNIVVVGYSIGTGSATYVASKRDVSGLVLVAPYDCALSLYNDVINIFHGPMEMLARYKFNSIGYAPDVKVQPLIITSKADEVISYQLSLNLSDNFQSDAKLLLLDDIGHNDYFSYDVVWENISDYLSRAMEVE